MDVNDGWVRLLILLFPLTSKKPCRKAKKKKVIDIEEKSERKRERPISVLLYLLSFHFYLH